MFQAPVSESKTQTPEARTQAAPEPHRELYPHLAERSVPQLYTAAGSGVRPGSPQLRVLQSSIGNQAVMRSLSHAVHRVQRKSNCEDTRSSCNQQEADPFRIQAKLVINRPGDEFEQEADHVSESVMRMPEPQLQRKCACGGICPDCGKETKEEQSAGLQLKRVNSNVSTPSEAPALVHEVLRSPGVPLDASTRAFMEPRFGRDFGKVRVHTDTPGERSASEINALAYTVGNNIVFGAGRSAQSGGRTDEGGTFEMSPAVAVVAVQSRGGIRSSDLRSIQLLRP